LPQQATEINVDLIGNELVHEGGHNVRPIIGLFIVQAFILASLLTSAPASGTPIPGNETGTVRAVIGFLFPLVGNPTVTSGLEMTSLGPTPLTVGHFDSSGAVVGGDVVVEVFIDLGTAPMDKVFLPSTNGSNTIFVTPQSPRASGILNAEGLVLPPNFVGIEPEFFQWSAEAGSEGSLFYGFALLTRADQPLASALGVTAQYQVVIGPPSPFGGVFLRDPTGSTFVTLPLTRGGAKFFTPVPEPSTVVLFAAGLIILGVAYLRRRRKGSTA
jgi:hypothetical protein